MEELLTELREAERKLRMRSETIPGLDVYANALARLAARVGVRPRVILMGETNAGKTSLANLMLGQAILPVGVLSNTSRPVVLRYSETTVVTGVLPDQSIDLSAAAELRPDMKLKWIEVGIQCRRLRSFDLVDTPGVTSLMQFDALALQMQTCDLLIWCTLATQAWKETERSLWMSLPPRHHRNGILVATHKDCLRDEADAVMVRARLATEAAGCFRSIALVGQYKRADQKEFGDDGLAELDARIGESLSSMSQRRVAAGYRIAGHIVRRALAMAERGQRSSTAAVDCSISRLFVRDDPAPRPPRGPAQVRPRAAPSHRGRASSRKS